MHLDSLLNDYITVVALLLLLLILIGVIARYLPLPRTIKKILITIIILGIALYLLRDFVGLHNLFERLKEILRI